MYHIGWHFADRPNPPHEAIAGVLGRMKDWARYSATGWLVWTDLELHEVYERLRPLMHANDFLLVHEVVNNTFYGWVPANIIGWIGTDRTAWRAGD